MKRVIGTLRREYLDHLIVFGETALYGHVKSFLESYHESRTHLSLAKDTQQPRPVQPPTLGAVVASRKLADFTTGTSSGQLKVPTQTAFSSTD